ncbi:MAG: alcohol dehydrogenase catalytic domain-containing protein [Clostridiales Family XIII bacterium]|jgi:L-iditol 2-dehydrogenase|nr:alcohol dehydrogenase catalytic domain-containing protein [Clostridiales Family XIII bacterium]
MKAIRKIDHGPGHLALVDAEEPQVRAGAIKIKVEVCGICGSDLHIVEGFEPPGASYPFPVTLGHEYSGTVVEVGEGVTDFNVGDRVTSNVSDGFCGKCYRCLSGNYYACPTNKNMGYECDGFMQEYAVVDAGIAFRLPDNISFEEGAQIEPACVAAFAVLEKVSLKPGDTCVVMGAGTIGLLVLQFVKLCGAKAVVVDLSSAASRLELAKRFGADCVLENDKADVIAEVRKLTAGVGADYVFECTAAERCINQSLMMLRRLGTLVELGITDPQGTMLRYFLFDILSGHNIICAFGHRLHTWPRVIGLVAAGKIKVQEMISHRFAFSDYEKAFRLQDPNKLKVLLVP